jgi:Methyltransferase domain
VVKTWGETYVSVFRKVARNLAVASGMKAPIRERRSFELSEDEVAELRASKSAMHEAFFAKSLRPAHKWRQYLDVYERHLSPYRDRQIFFLEIGVMDGGSLEMWRRFFGQEATIVGIDINPDCAKRVDHPNYVRIGSQNDPAFLRRIIEEFGAPDVVLDDGSHVARHQRASFDILFPSLKTDGLYIIEDVHTSYWKEYEGGYRRRGTAIEFVKQMIDDLHGWYHSRPTVTSADKEIDGIHIYDSVVVLEKKIKQAPGFLEGGIG